IRSGAAADSIAVAARSLANGAAQELGAAFDRVGVPWRERRGRPALPVPTVRLALSLLELIDQDFPREPLIDLLSSRLVWLAEDGDRLPPAALARVLRESHARDDATAGGYAAALSSLARRLERKERGAAHVEETSRRVQRAIAALRRPPAPGTLRELPGRSFDHLLLTGLVDGELPARPLPDPLLSDEERRAINRAAKRMVFRAASGSGEPGLLPPRQAEETLLFHLALCAARRSA